ncbi:hypothetical protein SAMN02745216_00458 [Desulfatibacillum alkenivorans DSM 16219]|uniref:Uncharacterized protein n=1 Tax=Desulfatibacillum alkenivorans DSM 16219 TaxID=1121393 RepID=A0A1M6DTZ0_9BACT|nr:hypothetical protein [Desulfatibacillum alkenivorans]SHI76714.1 hypothetical protein SAMN02745216_00458 [Desulfatibacillum alkenivorans DSM 16219]
MLTTEDTEDTEDTENDPSVASVCSVVHALRDVCKPLPYEKRVLTDPGSKKQRRCRGHPTDNAGACRARVGAILVIAQITAVVGANTRFAPYCLGEYKIRTLRNAPL